MEPLIPAAVVVDTENVRAMGEAVLGLRRWPSMAGIAAALATYGFDATTIGVSVAFGVPKDLQDTGRNSDIARRHRQAERYEKEVIGDPRGLVLRAHWGRTESGLCEKAADVACAVEICRRAVEIHRRETPARAILVLSEDSDLGPALDYARALGVAVYTLGTRGRLWWSSSWIALHDGPLRSMLAVGADEAAGWHLRGLMVSALRDAARGARGPFRAELERKRRESADCLLRHPLGPLPASVAVPNGALPRHAQVYVAGINPGKAGEKFPRLVCSQADPDHVAALRSGVVYARTTVLGVKVKLGTRIDEAFAPLGGITHGSRVAVFERQCIAIDGTIDTELEKVRLLRVIEPLATSRAIARDDAGMSWLLDDPMQEMRPGDRFAGLQCGHAVQPMDSPVVRPVSTRLPRIT